MTNLIPSNAKIIININSILYNNRDRWLIRSLILGMIEDLFEHLNKSSMPGVDKNLFVEAIDT